MDRGDVMFHFGNYSSLYRVVWLCLLRNESYFPLIYCIRLYSIDFISSITLPNIQFIVLYMSCFTFDLIQCKGSNYGVLKQQALI